MVYLSKFSCLVRPKSVNLLLSGFNKLWSKSNENVLGGGILARNYCPCPVGMKVTICGAAGKTGQPLALLLKQCPALDEIALYDRCATCGFGMELSHVDTKCKVSSFSGPEMLCEALQGSKVVIIVVRKEADTFECNAPIVSEITLQICNVCPAAFVIVATEPVESLVPLVGEIQRLRGIYNPRMLLGCVELNCIRANTVLADFLKVPPETVRVPVIGGATPQTMVPVLSSCINPCNLTQEEIEFVTSCIMSGNEVVAAAKGSIADSPSLAGAYAVARTTINVVKGLQGQKDIIQCAYVDSMGCCAPDCQFFCSDVILGAPGVAKILGVPELTKFENCLLCNCVPYVRNEIARAIWLVYSMCMQCSTATCPVHPNTCFTPPVVPCVPPAFWTCDTPDKCRDEYVASICRKMTCHCKNTQLCWRPRDSDYNATQTGQRCAGTAPYHCMPAKEPRSLRINKQIVKTAFHPCEHP